MLNVIAGDSGTGKTALVMAYAEDDLFVLTPNTARAKQIRADLRAEDRIKIGSCHDLGHLCRRLEKLRKTHTGPVLVDDYKQVCNATVVAFTSDEDMEQEVEQVDRAVYAAVKRQLVASIALMYNFTTFLTTQLESGGSLTKMLPAAGTRASCHLLVEGANTLIPLASLTEVREMDGDGGQRRASIHDIIAAKKAGNKGKKGKGKKGKDKAPKAPPVASEPIQHAPLDWAQVPLWDIVADLRGGHFACRQNTGLTGIVPPYGPLLFEGVMIPRPDPKALKVLQAIRAREVTLRDSGYSRLYLKIQEQIAAWGDYTPADII